MHFRTAEAELAALGTFDWIVEDGADMAQIFVDTRDAYADEVEDLRADVAGTLPPERVTFHLFNGEPWARTDLRPRPR